MEYLNVTLMDNFYHNNSNNLYQIINGNAMNKKCIYYKQLNF